MRGRGDEGSGAVEGASQVIYGRDLFSSGCVSDKRFEIVFGKNVPPAESVTAERMRRHRGWVKMDF